MGDSETETASLSEGETSDTEMKKPPPPPPSKKKKGKKAAPYVLAPTTSPSMPGTSSAISKKPVMDELVAHLKAPKLEIEKFSGDPMNYKKFLRQFDMRVLTDSYAEKVQYLDAFTIGTANRIVRGFCHIGNSEVAYHAILQEFEERFGDPELVVNAYVQKILSWPAIKVDDPKGFDDFSLLLTECHFAVTDMDAMAFLEYPENFRKIVGKLPYKFHEKWRNIVYDKKEKNTKAKFADLVKFVKKEAKKLMDPAFGELVMKETTRKFTTPSGKPPVVPNVKPPGKKFAACQIQAEVGCLFCSGAHKLSVCPDLQVKSQDDKFGFFKQHGLCTGCETRGHIKRDCGRKQSCDICKRLHLTVFHKTTPEETVDDATTSAKLPVTSNGGHADCRLQIPDCTMAIVPVKVRIAGSLRSITSYAFMDPGSNISFCSERLVKALGVERKLRRRITLHAMGVSQDIATSQVSGLELMNLSETSCVALPDVFTKDDMPVSKAHIPTQEDVKAWSHLDGTVLPMLDAEIDLLIGNNIPDAYTPMEVKTGPKGSPHATKTALGWITWNVLRETDTLPDLDYSVNRIDVDLDGMYNKIVNIDFPETVEKSELSVEDQMFLRKMEDEKSFVGNHMELPLPFRKEPPHLVDNKTHVLRRLASQKKRLSDPVYYNEYSKFMQDMEDAGYSERVPETELDRNERVWYIPHHGIYHPQKRKLRVVFDCSSRYYGSSLNDTLIPGPNLTNGLFGVLLRFRQESIAVLGDIEKMFYQVGVKQNDRDCLRYFWWPDGNLERDPVMYRMTVHVFGAVSSPSCSSFALKHALADRDDLKRCFYVDDFLCSTVDVDSAIEVVRDVTYNCSQGGFHLRSWVSNSRDVLQSIPTTERVQSLQSLDFEEFPAERALGIQWNVGDDDLVFHTRHKSVDEGGVTRRNVLSVASSLYDPHGLLAPVVLPVKILLQSLCKRGQGWDEQLTGDDLCVWTDWWTALPLVRDITIPRCLKPNDFNINDVQLHYFADASEVAYGVVCYIRFADADGRVSCNLLASKSRVAPINRVTIPRLELTAATVAVKLNSLITTELTLKVDQVYFWTDSMAVIRYIANVRSRFKTFVANRLTTIHEGSSVDQWNFVESKLNPGDIASRGLSPYNSDQIKLWLCGPQFLYEPKTKWPSHTEDLNIDNDCELQSNVAVGEMTNCMLDDLIDRFSSWTKLVRVLARVITFVRRLQDKVHGRRDYEQGPVLPSKSVEDAEIILVKHVQRKHYESELRKLSVGEPVKRSSTVARLDPFVEDGILRVGGRLRRSSMAYHAKHQILIPKQSRLALLLLQHVHRKVGHLGKNAMQVKLREKFWIPTSGALIKGITSKCVICRKVSGVPGSQKMADLPKERVAMDKPPFAYTGMDYFGPFFVKRGRSQVKRYGVVFSCLTSRAVHIEVAHTLDTDSCISAIRRFVARRGKVESITSDNGTNLVGAERELRENIAQWNQNQISKHTQQCDIVWNFNPPYASHFGGIWERMIRSIRKILLALIMEQPHCLDDESLTTLMCEVEHILNSRPISAVQNDPMDVDALTPNHLLLVNPDLCLPPGVFDTSDNYPRRRWRQIQYLSNLFWKRWYKEYVRMLQERSKWLKPQRNFAIGDLVLVVENVPRSAWTLGRVIDVHPDSQGLVRVVSVNTKSGVIRRPMDKLCLVLEVD